MPLKRAYFTAISLLALSFCTYADSTLHLEPSIGLVSIENREYDEGYVLDHAFAVSSRGFMFRAGVLHMAGITPEGVASTNDAEIKITAAHLGASKIIDLNIVLLEIGGGLLYSETKARFMGRELAEDRDTSPMFNAKVIRKINDFFAVQADWKYMDDLSGGNVHTLQAGVRFSF